MALSVAGVVSVHAAATTATTGALASTPAVGDLITLLIGSNGTKSGDYTTSTPSDSKGNTYTQCGTTVSASPSANNFHHVSIWRTVVTTGGASMTFTSTVAGAPTSPHIYVFAIHQTGNDTTTPYNGDMDGNTGSATGPTTGPSSPAPAANSLFHAIMLCDRSDSAAPSGWNSTDPTTPGLTAGEVTSLTLKSTFDCYCALKLASAAQTPTWGTMGGSSVYAAAVASFQPVVTTTAFTDANFNPIGRGLGLGIGRGMRRVLTVLRPAYDTPGFGSRA